jgi:preprotein translocase subunit SecD
MISHAADPHYDCPSILMAVASTDAMPDSRGMKTDYGTVVHVARHSLLTIRDFTDASVTITEGQIVLNVGLRADASERWGKFTAEHVGTMIAMVVNDRLVKFAKILDPNVGKGFLVGPLANAEAHELARAINGSHCRIGATVSEEPGPRIR